MDATNTQQQKPHLLADYFNLHPMDAQNEIVHIDRKLEDFTYAFKDRIQVEIEYAKGLLKVGRLLQKYIDPQHPSPLSYISSAFKVAHDQRARHALQLSQYLHTQIQVICQNLLKEHLSQARTIDHILKEMYQQGEDTEQSYEKAKKRYHRMKQEWQQKMMTNLITLFNPAVSDRERNKATARLVDQRKSLEVVRQKYMTELERFNRFAQHYNEQIGEVMGKLEERGVNGVAVQADCMRKLIVSQINMFKNIQYDLLNVSKQMQVVRPGEEIKIITEQFKDNFNAPILDLYANAQGSTVQSNHTNIDLKQPVKNSLLESSLNCIDMAYLFRMQANRTDSTLMYCVERACRRAQGNQAEGQPDFMDQFEDAVANNKLVNQMAKDNSHEQLNGAQAVTVAYQVVIWVACFLRQEGIIAQTRQEMTLKIKDYLLQHHFYRFLALLALQKSQFYEEGLIRTSSQNFLAILKLIIQESYQTRDVFVIRQALSLLFSCRYRPNQGDEETPLYESSVITELQIWNSLDFWYAAVFESSYEEISSLPLSDRVELRQVFLMRQKNLVFSGLTTYCHYMAMLGQQGKAIRTVIGRFAKLYHLVEEHQRDLSKTISSAVQQHKAPKRL